MNMTEEEAISLLTQVHKILVNCNSWLESTHEPLNMAFDMAIKAIKQKPKTGHWIRTDKYESYWYRCSECCRGSDDLSDYCPGCGARMKSEESE